MPGPLPGSQPHSEHCLPGDFADCGPVTHAGRAPSPFSHGCGCPSGGPCACLCFPSPPCALAGPLARRQAGQCSSVRAAAGRFRDRRPCCRTYTSLAWSHLTNLTVCPASCHSSRSCSNATIRYCAVSRPSRQGRRPFHLCLRRLRCLRPSPCGPAIRRFGKVSLS